MKIHFLTTMCLTMALAAPAACGDDHGAAGQDATSGQDAVFGQDASPGYDAAAQQDAAVAQDNWLGAACTCTGQDCDQLGVPKPSGGTIEGCENVPTWTGADLVCLRSYTGALATDTFFANGFCGLMATRCTGDSMICNSAVMGDYDAMLSCPEGSVMIQDSKLVEVFNNTATVDTKVCVPSCETSADCREGETDPVFNDELTQYQCIDKDGTKFCYDIRNLGAGYTATAY